MPSVIAGKVITLLEADNTQFKQKIGESQKKLGGLTASFGPLKVAGVAAFAAISATAIKSIKAYNVQEKAVAKLNAVLKATGGAAKISSKEMQNNASELQNITTYGDEAIISMQAVLATFTNIKGDVFKDATKSILDMSAVLDGDLKGGAIQLGKALNSPIEGISALSRVGVSFTKIQKDMIRNFVEQGDIVSAQRVILRELKNEFGGTAEAMARTFGGQIDQMKNAWGDLKEQIGKTIAISLGFKEGVGGEDNLVTKLTDLVKELGVFVGKINDGTLKKDISEISNTATKTNLRKNVDQIMLEGGAGDKYLRMTTGGTIGKQTLPFIAKIPGAFDRGRFKFTNLIVDQIMDFMIGTAGSEVRPIDRSIYEAKLAINLQNKLKQDIEKDFRISELEKSGMLMSPRVFGGPTFDKPLELGVNQSLLKIISESDKKELPNFKEIDQSLSNFFEDIDANTKLLNQFDKLRIEQEEDMAKDNRVFTEDRLSGAFLKGSVEANRILTSMSTNTPEQKILKNVEEMRNIIFQLTQNGVKLDDVALAQP